MFQRDESIATAPSMLERVGATVWSIQVYGLVLMTFLSFFPSWFHREEYLFFALLLIAIATAWWEGKPIWTRTPIDLPLLLFVGWVLLTIPFATDPAYSFAEWRKLVSQVLVFYWTLLVFQINYDGALIRRVLAAIAVGTLVLSTYALVDFVAQGGSWKGRVARASAPSSDGMWLSTYLVIAIPLLVAVVISMRSKWKRFACGSALCLAGLAQILTYTRGGWLGSVSEGIAFGLFTGRRRLIMGVLGCCLVFSIGLLSLSKIGYQLGVTSTHSLYERVAVWQLGLQEIIAHPFVGVGYGDYTFLLLFGEYPEAALASGLHNTFLIVAMGSGLPAVVFLAAVLVIAVRELLGCSERVLDRGLYGFLVADSVMIIGFAVRNFFDYMFAGSLAYLFWIVVATGLAQTIPKANRPQSPKAWRPFTRMMI